MKEELRFKNRFHAGALLAQQLRKYTERTDSVVLALPRGGVPVGFSIAQTLNLPLDVFMVKKIGVPGHEEFAFAAVTSGGQRVVQPGLAQQLHISDETIEELIRSKLFELAQREKLYDDRPRERLDGKIIILVDDGLATGLTMLAAIQDLRRTRPKRIVVAVPVGARESLQLIKQSADELVCLSSPEEFNAVSLWYQEFNQVSDDEAVRLLKEAARCFEASSRYMPDARDQVFTQSARSGNTGYML